MRAHKSSALKLPTDKIIDIPGTEAYRGAGGECILKLGAESVEIDEQRRYVEPAFRKLKQLKHTGRGSPGPFGPVDAALL